MSEKNDNLPVIFFICIATLIVPIILMPIEKIAPYPFVFEEILKAVLVLLILNFSKHQKQLVLIIAITFLFALSENIFYSTNFITNGILYNFWQRFILTTTLHILTALIIFIPSQKKIELITPVTILAMIIHYFYNQLALLAF